MKVNGLCAVCALAVLVLVLGCGTGSDGGDSRGDGADGGAAGGADGGAGVATFYGAEFEPVGAIDLATVVAAPESHAGRPIIVRATVTEVCQVSGCWMTLDAGTAQGAAAGDHPGGEGEGTAPGDPGTSGSAPGAAEDVIVQFKDYGFFVPKDCAGREVVVAGELQRVERSVAELRHLAAAAGRPEAEIAAITEPEMAWRIEATGVLIRASDAAAGS
jgi:hypothetical protein